MNKYRISSAILVVTSLFLLLITPTAITQTTQDPTFSTQYGVLSQKLFVSVQPSLCNYYSNMTDTIARDSDYAKLITPQAVQPIAENILKITQNMPYSDEQFANAVLSVVHQIPYNITGAKYPVETLVDNIGDCGAVSLLAASIMKAGGLDVVLIKYNGIDPGHMNVGVYLSYTPIYHSLLMSPTGFEYNNKTYWTAEATPQGDWKVGDQSYTMANAIPQIIPIDNCEAESPGQVTANLGIPPHESSITINLSQQSTNMQEKKRALLISGSTQPATPNSSVTLYINENGTCTNYWKADTDDMGKYAYLWNFTKDGTYFISASWSGNGTSTGIDSETLVAFIGPQALVQFENNRCNYVIGIPIADIAIRRFIGIEDFLNIPLGTNVSVSYSFRVLQTGSIESEIPTENYTVPAQEFKITNRRGQTQIIQIPARTVTVPTDIPLGMTALSLPDDFNQTINSKFCLIIEEEKNNTYSLNVKGLNDHDLSGITDNQETKDTFLNATEDIEKSTLYRVTATITANGIHANLQREDGTPIESLSTSNNSKNKQFVLLIANNVDSAVILSDFKIGAANTTVQTPDNPKPTPGIITVALPYYLYLIAAIAIALAVAIVYIKTKTSNLPRQHESLREEVELSRLSPTLT